MKNPVSFEIRYIAIMDILDWFNDPLADYLADTYIGKLDGKERIDRVMPDLIKHCQALVKAAEGTDRAYVGAALGTIQPA